MKKMLQLLMLQLVSTLRVSTDHQQYSYQPAHKKTRHREAPTPTSFGSPRPLFASLDFWQPVDMINS